MSPDQSATHDEAPAASEGPPGDGRSRARTTVVLVGALAVVGVVVAALALSGVGGGGGGGGGAKEQHKDAAYRLRTPGTVAGTYRREGRGSVHSGDRIFTGAPQSGEGGGKGGEKVPGMATKGVASATYKSHENSTLALNGAYGRLSAPGKSVDWLLSRTARNLAEINAKPKGNATTVSPAGFDGDVLKCRQYEVRSAVKTSSLTNCAWGDSSTLGSVLVVRLTRTKHDPAVPKKEAAKLTAKVRADARVRAAD